MARFTRLSAKTRNFSALELSPIAVHFTVKLSCILNAKLKIVKRRVNFPGKERAAEAALSWIPDRVRNDERALQAGAGRLSVNPWPC